MLDFDAVEKTCKANSDVSTSLIDGFLIDYVFERERLMPVLERELDRYAHVTEVMPNEWVVAVYMQLAAHRLFRKGGLARGYRGHSAIRQRSSDERDFFDAQIEQPWKWCFAAIEDTAGEKFFFMRDVLTDDRFQLYSPAVEQYLSMGHSPTMMLMLLGYDHQCRQMFGPLMPFMGLLPFDLLFIARTIDPRIRRMADIPALIERDPLPFIMLWRGGGAPMVVHGKDTMIHYRAELSNVDLDPEAVRQKFTLESRGAVTRLSLKRWNRHPHYAEAFHDAEKRRLLATALTERAWEKLAQSLYAGGLGIPRTAERRISVTGLTIARIVLNREIASNPYSTIFEPPTSPTLRDEHGAVNRFLDIYFTAHNAGVPCNIDAAAAEAGIPPEMAHEIVATIRQKMGR